MSFDPRQLAAFVEYVIRPLSEDWRVILEKTKELNLPISEALVKSVTRSVCWTLVAGEVLRLVCYTVVAWLACQTVMRVLCT